MLWFTITLVVTSLALIVVLQLWRADPHVPVGAGIDNEFTLMTIKNVLREGWVNQSPHLGAPFGQRLYDFPVVSADVLHLLIIKGLGLLTSDPAAVMNCVYGLSFLMVSACAFVAFRLLKVSPPMACAGAVLYSFLPYHFLRGGYYGHLTLASYFMVPLVCALLVRQLGDEPLLDLRRGANQESDNRVKRSRAVLAIAICVVGALTSVYYAVFAMLLLAFAGLARALTIRSFRPLLASFILAGVMVATLATALLPNLLYYERQGRNQEVARRVATESEVYGLKIVNLLLPTPEHRISALDLRFGEKSVLPGEGTETLGLIGGAGFIGLLLIACRRLLGRGSDAGPATSMATLLLFTVLLGTVAGFSAVLASLGFVQIRGWNRISIFVAFFALGAVALALDRVSIRAEGARTAATRLGLSMLVLVVGVVDQTSTSFVPAYDEASATWRSDESFIRTVEKSFGEADVFQLPIMPFPEPAAFGFVYGNAHLRGYLHSDTLRWSFGGMRSRESYWQEQLLSLPTLEVIPRVALAGFEALYIDRDGYSNQGRDLEGKFRPYLNQPLVSADGRLAVYDLRPLQRELEGKLGAARAAAFRQFVLQPSRLQWSSDFGGPAAAEGVVSRSAESRGEVRLVNRTTKRREVVFSFDLESPVETAVVVNVGDRLPELHSPGGRRTLELPLSLKPGETKIVFRSELSRARTSFPERVPRRIPVGNTAGSLGDLRFSVINPRLDEGIPDLAGLLESVPLPAPAAAVMPPLGAPHRPFPPLLMLGAVLILGVVFVAATDQCLRALLYPRQRPRLRRPIPAL